MKRCGKYLLPILITGVAQAADMGCITETTAFGCNTQSQIEELQQLASEDPQALMRGLFIQYARGACTKLIANETVFIQGSTFFLGQYKVRRQSSVSSLWVAGGFIRSGACTGPAASDSSLPTTPAATPRVTQLPKITRGDGRDVQPRMADPEPRKCEWKAVMSDDDIAACREP